MKSEEAQMYCDLMLEAKHRTNVLASLLKGDVSLGYLPVDVETAYLQFRKILELIAFGSLIANKEKYAEVRKQYAKDWNAKRVLNLAENLNPEFYPVPIAQIPVEGKSYSTELKKLESGFLTRKDFEVLYDQCGGVLHSENPYGDKYKYDQLWGDIPYWALKIRNLLNCHGVHLVGDKGRFYLIQMGAEGSPTYTLFEEVGEIG